MQIHEIETVVNEMKRLAELHVYLYGKSTQGSNTELMADTKSAYKALAKLIEGVNA